MRRMELYTDKDIETCKRLLLQNIRVCKISPALYTPSPALNDEIVGNIHKDKFWLEHTKPDDWGCTPRVFVGKFISRDHGTEIVGKFHFRRNHKIVLLASLLFALKGIFFDTGFYRHMNFEQMSIRLFIVFSFFFFVFGIFSLGINKKQESAVILLLEHLFNPQQV